MLFFPPADDRGACREGTKKQTKKTQDYFTRHQMNAKKSCHCTKRGCLIAINIITDYESIVADKKF